MDIKEEWRKIYGKYEVSNTGKVRSLNYNNTGKLKELKLKELKLKENKYGQMEVKLSQNNKAKDYMVARLVATIFIPNPQNKPLVIHKNKDKKDNSINNLEWAYTSEEKHNTYNKGSRKNAVPSFTKITYKGKNYKKYSQIAKEMGINQRTFNHRLELGWGLNEALEIPVGNKKVVK